LSPKIRNRTEKQIQRNIKKELGGSKPEKTELSASPVFHMLAVLTCILLPITLVAIISGIVFRMPDLMALELSRSGILSQMEIKMTPDEIAGEVFAYINHETDALSPDVFPVKDEANLERIRDLLDKSLIPSVIVFILSLSFSFILWATGYQRYLKISLRGSVIFYICTVLFVVSLALFWPFRHLVFSLQPGIEYATGSVLMKLLGGFFPIFSASVIVLISFIIYIALYSILLRFTVEKEKLFK